MPHAVCKLCNLEKELQDSHYLPKSLYRRMKREGRGDPIVMTPGLIISTSKQVHDYVFCAECEDRFNDGGERYSLSLVADDKKFPLRDMLSTQTPGRWGSFLQLSAIPAGVDTDKLAHFAIGLLWKGAVHGWRTFGQQTTKIRTFPHMEAARRFLLGEMPLPSNFLIFILVCLDSLSHAQIMAPYLIGGHEEENRYEMLVRGIKIQIAIDPPQIEIDNLCCVHCQRKPIFAANCHDATFQSVRHFHQTAHLSKNLP